MYGILYDKERLERGQSTANVHSVVDDIAAIKSSKADMKLSQKPQAIDNIDNT
jgi:hypothetical protein